MGIASSVSDNKIRVNYVQIHLKVLTFLEKQEISSGPKLF